MLRGNGARRSEYGSAYVSRSPPRSSAAAAAAVSARVSCGPTVSQNRSASAHHLRKSKQDMIPATAVAIPTAMTHRSPKKTVVTRTTYAIVRTPNVSAVHVDPLAAALPSADVSVAEPSYYSRSGGGRAAAVPVSAQHHHYAQQRRTPPSSAVATPAAVVVKNRALERQVDVVMAKNRDLELQLLQLRRELMMARASTRPSSTSKTRNSASATAAHSRRDLSSASRVANESQVHALQLLDELRSTLVQQPAAQRSFPTEVKNEALATTKSVKKHKKRRTSGSKQLQRGDRPRKETPRLSEADLLLDAIHRQGGAATRHSGSDGNHVLLSPSRRPSRREASDDEFEAAQQSYWAQSQMMLRELDRRLQHITKSGAR